MAHGNGWREACGLPQFWNDRPFWPSVGSVLQKEVSALLPTESYLMVYKWHFFHLLMEFNR